MYSYLHRSGPVVIWIIACIPILLFCLSGEAQFDTIWQTLRTTGQLCGLIGLSLFALNFVLSARFRFVEELFAGLDKAYQAHHKLGSYAFIFMLLHPMFLALQYLGVSSHAVVLFLKSGLSDFAVIWGELAIAVVFVILCITLYIHLRYEKWKLIHQWIGVGLLFAGMHMYLIPSTTARFAPLRWYMIALVLIGILSWISTMMRKYSRKKQYIYSVNNIVLSPDIIQIHMHPKTQSMKHAPGQFAFFSFGNNSETHPFSFTSAGTNGEISIAVKTVGDYTRELQSIQVGAPVYIEGPYGKFGQSRIPGFRQIWVAGGIGVTPFVSMTKNLAPDAHTTTLWLSVKNQGDSPFLSFFEQAQRTLDNFTFHMIETESEGYITASRILQGVNVNACQIYLCGPKAMTQSLVKQCMQAGVPRHRIYFEDFALYRD